MAITLLRLASCSRCSPAAIASMEMPIPLQEAILLKSPQKQKYLARCHGRSDGTASVQSGYGCSKEGPISLQVKGTQGVVTRNECMLVPLDASART